MTITNKKTAVIFSPIMPQFNTLFCANIISYLESLDYQVIVYDSLFVIKTAKTFNESVNIWNDYLSQQNKYPEIVIGQAFGGMLVSALLDKVYKTAAKAILISSPIKVNARLYSALQNLIDAYAQGTDKASAMLEDLVLPLGAKATINFKTYNINEEAMSGVINGYRLLQQANCESNIEKFLGNILSIYGCASQLVNADNICLNSLTNKNMLSIGVTGCGMRPLRENPIVTMNLIKSFMENRLI